MRILAIEGMLSLPLIQNQLIRPLGLMGQTEFTSWNGNLKECDILIAHSLGGGRAFKDGWSTFCTYLITLDPRHMSNLGWTDILFRWQEDFTAPKDVECYNFVHTPATVFPGYIVDGAINQSVLSTHFTICGHPAVRACLKGILSK